LFLLLYCSYTRRVTLTRSLTVGRDFGEEISFAAIRGLLEECIANHDDYRTGSHEEPQLPRRALDVSVWKGDSGSGDAFCALYESAAGERSRPFIFTPEGAILRQNLELRVGEIRGIFLILEKMAEGRYKRIGIREVGYPEDFFTQLKEIWSEKMLSLE